MRTLHQDASAETLGVARVLLYGIWLVTLLLNPLWDAAVLPVDWATLKGPSQLLPERIREWMLSLTVLTSLQIVLLGLCTALMIGIRPFQPIAIVFGFLILLFDAIWKSFQGYLNHDKFAALYAVWIMAMYPAADSVSILGGRKSKLSPGAPLYRAPMVAIPMVMCMTYMLIGLRRISRGDAQIFLGDAMPTYFATRTMFYSFANFKFGLLILTWPVFFFLSKLGLFVATFFELSSPWTLLSDRFRRVWLVVIFSFHVLTVPLMNIIFWENMFLILIFLTKLPESIAARFIEERGLSAAPLPATDTS